jgi:predicted DNA-binding transcriptional regulator AlpA
MKTDRLISYREAGHMCGGICARTVRRKIAGGELPQPVYFGKRPMLSLLEVEAVIEKLKQNRGEKGNAYRHSL